MTPNIVSGDTEVDPPCRVRNNISALRPIAESGVRPQLVLCSTATRARRTLELVLPSLDTTGSSDGEPVVSFDAGLYHASADALLECVRELDMDVDDVLIVGHNPGLQDLALRLSAPAPARRRAGT